MTNREILIHVLENSDSDYFDDGGATEEAVIYYNIGCPYFCGDSRCHCGESLTINREMCSACKYEWLDMEVDEQ